MEASLISALPNLGVGVVSILAVGYIVNKFLLAMDERTVRHQASMNECEAYLRTVEKEIRTTLSTSLHESTKVIEENRRVMVLVLDRLSDRDSNKVS